MMQDLVREFHEKHGYPVDKTFTSMGLDYNAVKDLRRTWAETWVNAEVLQDLGVYLQEHIDQPIVYRFHLMLEEISEAMDAVLSSNKIEFADAMTDLLYVVVGTFVTYGLPMEKLFNEVHRSNMTKMVRNASVDPRLRSKGSEYSPPRIMEILDEVL